MVYPHEGFKRNKRLGSWLVIRCYYKYLFLSFLSGCFFDCFFSFDHYSGGVVLFWLTPDIYISLSLSPEYVHYTEYYVQLIYTYAGLCTI